MIHNDRWCPFTCRTKGFNLQNLVSKSFMTLKRHDPLENIVEYSKLLLFHDYCMKSRISKKNIWIRMKYSTNMPIDDLNNCSNYLLNIYILILHRRERWRSEGKWRHQSKNKGRRKKSERLVYTHRVRFQTGKYHSYHGSHGSCHGINIGYAVWFSFPQ